MLSINELKKILIQNSQEVKYTQSQISTTLQEIRASISCLQERIYVVKSSVDSESKTIFEDFDSAWIKCSKLNEQNVGGINVEKQAIYNVNVMPFYVLYDKKQHLDELLKTEKDLTRELEISKLEYSNTINNIETEILKKSCFEIHKTVITNKRNYTVLLKRYKKLTDAVKHLPLNEYDIHRGKLLYDIRISFNDDKCDDPDTIKDIDETGYGSD